MKIAVNTQNYEILNSLIRSAQINGNTVAIAKLETSLFEHIDKGKVDAYILSGDTKYVKKSIDFIKRNNLYTPIVSIGYAENSSLAESDIIIPFNDKTNVDYFAESILHNIYAYAKNFEILQRLSAKMDDIIEFGNCKYDPMRRILYLNDIEIQKLSPKQAGIFELLTTNFKQIVKREIILQKVWHQSNYFVGRSLDVFVTHLRKILKNGGVEMSIINVANVGLMLNYSSYKNKV